MRTIKYVIGVTDIGDIPTLQPSQKQEPFRDFDIVFGTKLQLKLLGKRSQLSASDFFWFIFARFAKEKNHQNN